MLSPFLPILAVIAGWTAFSFGAAYLGGWRDLARKFPPRAVLPAKMFFCPAACMGDGPGYRWIILIGFSADGVSVRTFAGLLFHPPLLVPWSHTQFRSSRDWLGEDRELVLAGEDGLHLFLSDAAFAQLAAIGLPGKEPNKAPEPTSGLAPGRGSA